MCKYFYSITHSLFVRAQLIVKKCVYFTHFTGQQNLTFFWANEEKYLILIELLKLN